jgi:predicted RNA methylase
MPINYDAARKAGYSDEDIAARLAAKNGIDLKPALDKGFSHKDIIDRFIAREQQPQPAETAPPAAAPPDSTEHEMVEGGMRAGAPILAAGEFLHNVATDENFRSQVAGVPGHAKDLWTRASLGVAESAGRDVQFGGATLQDMADIQGMDQIDEKTAIGMLTPKRRNDAVAMAQKEGISFGEAAKRMAVANLGELEKTGKAIEKFGKTGADFQAEIAEKYKGAADLEGKNVVDNPELIDDPRYWAGGFAEIVPSVGGVILSAMGTKTAIARPGMAMLRKAAKSTATDPKKLAAMEKNVMAVASRIGAVAGGATGASMEAGSTYNEVLERTGDEDQAAAAAMMMAGAVTVLDSLGSMPFLEKLGNSVLSRGLVGFVMEGGGESLEQPAEVAAKVVAATLDGTMAEILSGENVPKDARAQFKQAWKEAATILPFGGGMGAASAFQHDDAKKPQDLLNDDKKQDDITGAIDDLLDGKETAPETTPAAKKKEYPNTPAGQRQRQIDETMGDERFKQDAVPVPVTPGQRQAEIDLLKSDEEIEAERAASMPPERPATFEQPVDQDAVAQELAAREQLAAEQQAQAEQEALMAGAAPEIVTPDIGVQGPEGAREFQRTPLQERAVEAGRKIKEAERLGLEISDRQRAELEGVIAEAEQEIAQSEQPDYDSMTPVGEPWPMAGPEIDTAANEAATSPTNTTPEPTEKQIEAGNYKKGHVKVQGLDISVENPAGSTRSGTDADGKPWSTEMQHHYGYIRGTEGRDGDQVDTFVGPNAESDKVFIVDQKDPKTGAFDEHKVLVGFDDMQAAIAGYDANYDENWKGRGPVTEMTVAEFKTWLKDGDQKTAVSPLLQPKQEPAAKEGLDTKTNVMGKPSTMIGLASADGVDFQLWEREDGSTVFRVIDTDSGETVGSTEYPAGNEKGYFRLTDSAERGNTETQWGKGHGPDTGGPKQIPNPEHQKYYDRLIELREKVKAHGDKFPGGTVIAINAQLGNLEAGAGSPGIFDIIIEETEEELAKLEKPEPAPEPEPDTKGKWVNGHLQTPDRFDRWWTHLVRAREAAKNAGIGKDDVDWTDIDAIVAAVDAHDKGEPKDKPAEPERKVLGKNRYGKEVGEDEDGNRYVVEDGYLDKAPVPVIPGRGAVPMSTDELYNRGRIRYLTDAELAEFEAKKKKPKPEPEPTTNDIGEIGNFDIPKLSKLFLDAIVAGKMPKNKIAVRKMVADALGIKPKELTENPQYSHKQVEEAFEYAVVQRARDIIAEGQSREDTFAQLEALYNDMPNLATRSSTSMQNQAYSTPVHLAYLMQEFAKITGKSWVYEPTAGTGMLLTAADPSQTWGNEINETRLEILKDQGMMTSNKDGKEAVNWRGGRGTPRPKAFDAVMANPPFGSIQTEVLDGYRITKLEHAIIVNALKAMKNDGRAALIIGGEHVNNNAKMNMNQRVFLNYLHQNFNVVANVEIPGEQYSKQGAKFPVRLILINGRRSSDAAPAWTPDTEGNVGDYEAGKNLPAYAKVHNIRQVAELIKEVENATVDTAGAPTVPQGEKSPGGDAADKGENDGGSVRGPRTGKGGKTDQGGSERTPDDRGAGGSTSAPTERPGEPGSDIPGSKGTDIGDVEGAGTRPDNAPSTQGGSGSGKGRPSSRPGGKKQPGDVPEGAGGSDAGGVSGTGEASDVDSDIDDLLNLSEQEAEKAKKREQAGKDDNAMPPPAPPTVPTEFGEPTMWGDIPVYSTPDGQFWVEVEPFIGDQEYMAYLKDAFLDATKSDNTVFVRNATKDGKLHFVFRIQAKTKTQTPSQKFKEGSDQVKKGIKDFNDILGEEGAVTIDPNADPGSDPRWEKLHAALKNVWDGLKKMYDSVKEAAEHFVKDIYKQLSSAGKPFVDKFIKEDIRADLVAEKEGKTEEPAPAPSEPQEAEETDYQVSYAAKSKGPIIDPTLTPKRMADATAMALDNLEQEVGDIDQFVANELQYPSVAELHKVLSADQVDAVALAIHNIQNNTGMIIGDQTGVGKGRIGAAIWRYARLNGKKPVFLTAKPDLFSDFYRDMTDIGFHFNPLIMASDTKANITDADGNIVHKLLAGAKRKRALEAVVENGVDGLGEYDGVVATYSQIAYAPGAPSSRGRIQQDVLARMFEDNIVILDEAHEASGASSTGFFIRDALSGAQGVTYLSATFAKRADTMPLYYRTDMSEANMTMEDLIDAVASGGTPLQEILSSDLAKLGQYVRREKSFKGIESRTYVDSKNRERDEDRSDAMTAVMRNLIQLEKQIVEEFNKAIRRARSSGTQMVWGIPIPGGTVPGAGNRRLGASVTTSNFASTAHNTVRQLLMGMKVDAAVEKCIAALEERSHIEKQDDGSYRIVNHDGRVIAENLDKQTAEMTVAPNGRKPFIGIDFTNGAFVDYLVETGQLSEGDDFNVSFATILAKRLSDVMTVEVTAPTGETIRHNIDPRQMPPHLQAFYNDAARRLREDMSEISGNPIDDILAQLIKAGYKVGEITGRSFVADLSNPDQPTLRSRSPKERSAAKKDTLRGYNNGTVDVIICNRSGAVGVSAHASPKTGTDTRPRAYIGLQAQLNVDNEMQLYGRINRKGQTSLPEYTTVYLDIPAELRPAAVLKRKMDSLSANTSANADGPLTQKTLPDMANKYGDRVVRRWLTENPQTAQVLGLTPQAGFMATAGKIAMMPIAIQREFFETIELDFQLEVQEAKEQGTYDLETQDLDYRAIVKEKVVVNAGGNEANPFGASTHREKLDVRNPVKPYNRARIKALLDEAMEGKSSPEILSAFYGELQDEVNAYIDERTEAALANNQVFNPANVNAALDFVRATLRRMEIGSTYRIQLPDMPIMTGVLLKVNRAKGRGNPAAGARVWLEFAVNNSLRRVRVTMSRMSQGTAQVGLQERGISERWDEVSQQNERGEVYMLTGNLLQGFGLDSTPDRSRIVRFSMSDGTMREGIHLPMGYDPASSDSGDRVQVNANQAADLLEDGQPLVGTTVKINSNGVISMPASRATGGPFFLDDGLRSMVERGDFETIGGEMRGRIRDGMGWAAISLIYELGDSFSVDRSVYDKTFGDQDNQGDVGDDVDMDMAPMPQMGIVTAQEIEGFIDPIAMTWKNAPPAEVVADYRGLPIEIQNAITRGSGPKALAGVRGVQYKGKIYLVANKFASKEDALRTYLHEVRGHLGIKGLLGNNYRKVMNQIWFAKAKEIRAMVAEFQSQGRYWNLDLSTEKGRIKAVDEWIAREAETNPQSSIIQSLIRQIREFLRSVGIKLELSDAEVRAIIAGAGKWVEKGEGTVAGRLLEADMSMDMDMAAILAPTDDSINVAKDTDLGRVTRQMRPPAWIAKRFPAFKKLFDRQIQRGKDRLRALAGALDETSAFWNMDTGGQDFQQLRHLVWRLEGERIKDLKQPKFAKDADGNYQINEAHYQEYRRWLDKISGLSSTVKDAFIDIRRSLDKDLATVYNRMSEMEEVDETVLERMRRSMGNIHNYFPHMRYGNQYVQVVKTEMEEDPETGEMTEKRTVEYREHVNGKVARNKLANKLREQYPEADGFEISAGAVQKLPEDVFSIPVPIEALDAIVSAAVDRVEDQETKDAFRQALPQALSDALKIRGWGSHMVKRKGIPGHEEQDIKRVLFDYKSGLYGWLTKMEASRDFSKVMQKVNAKKHPNLWAAMRTYTYDMLRNSDGWDRAANTVRALAFAKYLGFNIKTSALNLTQNLIAGWPRLGMDVGGSAGLMIQGAASSIVNAWTKGQQLPMDEQKLIHDLHSEGITNSQFLNEVKGQIGSNVFSLGNKVMSVLGWPMAAAETLNRTSLALAAYRAATTGKINNAKTLAALGLEPGQKADYETAKKFAEEMVNDAHFVYGEQNRPEALRGGTANRMASVAYTFRTFTHNLINLWKWQFSQGGRGKVAIAKSLAATIALGGISSIPLYKTLMHILREMTGEDPEEVLTGWTGDADWLRDIVVYGVPAISGFTIGGSIGMELPIFDRIRTNEDLFGQVGGSLTELIGVPWAMVEDIGRSVSNLRAGKGLFGGLEPLAPAILANPMRGAAPLQRRTSHRHRAAGEPAWQKRAPQADHLRGRRQGDRLPAGIILESLGTAPGSARFPGLQDGETEKPGQSNCQCPERGRPQPARKAQSGVAGLE